MHWRKAFKNALHSRYNQKKDLKSVNLQCHSGAQTIFISILLISRISCWHEESQNEQKLPLYPQKLVMLTGLSSVISHSRYSATCIICAMIFSSSYRWKKNLSYLMQYYNYKFYCKQFIIKTYCIQWPHF